MTLKERIEKAKKNPTKLSKAAALALIWGTTLTVGGATVSVIFLILVVTWPLLLVSAPVFLLGLVLLSIAVGLILADTINQVIHGKAK